MACRVCWGRYLHEVRKVFDLNELEARSQELQRFKSKATAEALKGMQQQNGTSFGNEYGSEPEMTEEDIQVSATPPTTRHPRALAVPDGTSFFF